MDLIMDLIKRLSEELKNQLDLTYDAEFDANAVALIEEATDFLQTRKEQTPYVPECNLYGDRARCPKENPNGLWLCSSPLDDPKDYVNFLEVHKSATGTKAVFRVSAYNGFQSRLQLGECAILDCNQLTQVRDRINALLEETQVRNLADILAGAGKKEGE